jgi:hypothetical protein
MDIRKDGQQHVFLRINPIGQACARIDGYQTTPRRRHAIRLKGGIEVKREGSSASAIRGAPQYRADR